MKWSSGGMFNSSRLGLSTTKMFSSITKLMGESFKLHSQALNGYENSMVDNHSGPADPLAAPHAQQVAAY